MVDLLEEIRLKGFLGLPTKILNKGILFWIGIGFCITATAQVPLLSDEPIVPAAVVQQEILAGRPDHSVVDPPPAGDIQGIFNKQYGQLLIKDIVHTITAPADWDSQDWQRMGLATAAIVGTGLLLDRPIRDAVQRNHRHSLDRIATIFEPFGAEYSLGVLGGFYLVGTLNNDATAMHVAQDGVASSVIASVIITPVLQRLTGRSRPRANEGVGSFHPFSGGHASLPSGHATQAFAVASVIASHYETPWVKMVSYGTAGLVGFSRIYHNAHFTSDVLAGGIIGTFVGHSVVAFNEQRRTTSKVSFMPMLAPGMTGITMQIRF